MLCLKYYCINRFLSSTFDYSYYMYYPDIANIEIHGQTVYSNRFIDYILIIVKKAILDSALNLFLIRIFKYAIKNMA